MNYDDYYDNENDSDKITINPMIKLKEYKEQISIDESENLFCISMNELEDIVNYQYNKKKRIKKKAKNVNRKILKISNNKKRMKEIHNKNNIVEIRNKKWFSFFINIFLTHRR